MVYKVIGLMSGSSLDGLDIVFAEVSEEAGAWGFEIVAASCYAYDSGWKARLQTATQLSAFDYQLLHVQYGAYLGAAVNRFVEEHALHYQVAFIASHGHTTFHAPAQKLTAQLGDGAALAAATGLPVVSDLRALDVAFGGQGAPIVPVGEKLFWNEYDLFLNIGGIANVSVNNPDDYIAFDVCSANRVLDALAQNAGHDYDSGGALAATGRPHDGLLKKLNALHYYTQPAPKSLANAFGADVVLPLLQSIPLSTQDALHTYVLHMAEQIKNAVARYRTGHGVLKMLVTGGGAFNAFLVQQIQQHLQPLSVEVVVPDAQLVAYKEALIMALLGVLRWRQAYTTLPSVTGAARGSIGGALWIGQEA